MNLAPGSLSKNAIAFESNDDRHFNAAGNEFIPNGEHTEPMKMNDDLQESLQSPPGTSMLSAQVEAQTQADAESKETPTKESPITPEISISSNTDDSSESKSLFTRSSYEYLAG